jgi:hypothetical protein
MHMVWHNFKSNNFNSHLDRFIFNNLHKSFLNITNKNRSSSFWTPDQMIIQKIYMIFCVLIFHVDNILDINIVVNKKAIHPLTKVRGFLAGSL